MTGAAESESGTGAASAEHGSGVLHLGEVGGSERPPSPDESSVPHSRHWMIMIAVFLVGVMVGSYAWLVRADMLDEATVDLIVTDLRHDAPHSDGTLTRITGRVRNIGSDDLAIINASIPGPPSGNDRDGDEVAVPAGEAATVAVDGELNCGTGLPDVIVADVRTSAGETSAELPVPATNVLHALQCRSGESGEVWVEVTSSAPASGDRLGSFGSRSSMSIPLSIRSWSVDEVEIVDVVVSSSPGLDAEPSGLVGRHDIGTVADLAAEWTVTDCSSAFPIEPIDITVGFADHPAATVRVPEAVQPTLVSLTSRMCGI